MSDRVLVIPAEEWSCNQRMRVRFDEPAFGNAHTEAIVEMLLWMDLPDEQPRYMIEMPTSAKPYRGEKAAESVHHIEMPRAKILSLDSHRLSFAIAGASALASIALIVEGDLLPVLATGTATFCFACLGYVQRLVQTTINARMNEPRGPLSA